MQPRARSVRGGLALAVGVALTTVFPAVGGAVAGDLDWCAPIVVRPTERIEEPKTCRWIWSKDEIAREAEIVYVGGEGMVSDPAARPHPMTCFGDATYANVAAYVKEVEALRPAGRPPLRWILYVRTDLVMDTAIGLPGFRTSFLVRTATPWRRVPDFFEKDKSGACPPAGCRWSESWGGHRPCDGSCLRERIEKAGPPGISEQVVYYLNLRSHPTYWPSAALVRLDDPEYRRWLVPELQRAHASTGVSYLELNHKLWQWHPKQREGGLALRAPRNPDVAGLRKGGGAWSAEPVGYGYPQYVAGWHALASELAAAGVPFSVSLGRALWDSPKSYDDPSTPRVDEAALLRAVAEQLANHVVVDAQGDRRGADRIAARLRGMGRNARAIDTNCGYAKKGP